MIGHLNLKHKITVHTLVERFCEKHKKGELNKQVYILLTELIFYQFGKKRVDEYYVGWINYYDEGQYKLINYIDGIFPYIDCRDYVSLDETIINRETILGKITREDCYNGKSWILDDSIILTDLLNNVNLYDSIVNIEI